MNTELYEHLRSYVVHMVRARPWRLCELQAHVTWDDRAVSPKHVAEVCDDLVDDDVIRLREDGFYESWY